MKDGENLSIIFEDYRVPLNTVYKILKLDRSNELRNIRPGDEIKFSFLNDEINRIEIKIWSQLNQIASYVKLFKIKSRF